MTPVEVLTLTIAVLAVLGAGAALTLWSRGTPRKLSTDADEITRVVKGLADDFDRLEKRVRSDLEEISDLYDRVESKRNRAATAAARAEKAATAAPAAESRSAQEAQILRSIGWK